MARLARTLAAAAAILAAGAATAADLPTKKAPPVPAPVMQPALWQTDITLYGWASSIAGNTGFGGLPTMPYYASFGKVLEHLQGALMGSVVARNGTFIVGLDAIWSRIGGSGTVEVNYGPFNAAGVNLTLTEALVTGFGGLRIPIGPPNLELYGTLGARYAYSGTKLTLNTPVPGFSLSTSVNKGWVNPVAGFAAQYRFDDRWFMNGLADIGGWSDSATGQALASVGYNWTKCFSTTLGYRAMYNYEKQDTGAGDRSFRYQQWMYGPFVGLKFSF